MPSRFLFPLLQITRRYAEFSAAIVGISESFPNEQVTKLLAQLLDEVECFVLRMAAIFPGRKEQLIFLINNYDMVLSILMVRFIIYNNPRGNNIPGNIQVTRSFKHICRYRSSLTNLLVAIQEI